jgi:spore coat polysaccharide biosynthesis protein SpsF (cytidylyltransferase family)
MSVGIVILAKQESKRLERKTLQEIKGKKTLEILIEHLLGRLHLLSEHEIVMAVPDSEDNELMCNIAISKGVPVFRGHYSPLHRLYECCLEYDFDHVVRITTDDILIDELLLHNMLNWHIKGGQDYTYMFKCPEGTAGDIFKVNAVKRAVEKAGDKYIEHVSYSFRNKDFRSHVYYPPPEYQYSFRLTMDYIEDLQLLKILFMKLVYPFGTLDIINFLREHKYLMNINRLPLVTLYTCNYNYSSYIIRCLESIFDSGFEDFELIVLDDHSSDDSCNKVLEFYSGLNNKQKKKMKIIRNNENSGLPASCNKVLEMAKGKYIMRVDSDDIIYKGIIDDMIDAIKMDGTAGAISGYNIIDEKNNKLDSVNKNMWHPACSLLRKNIVNELKYKEGLNYFEGDEFFKRFRQLHDVSFLDRCLWGYRRHENQKTNSKNDAEREKVKKELEL